MWEGVLLQTPQRGRDCTCFYSRYEKFGMCGTRYLCFKRLMTDCSILGVAFMAPSRTLTRPRSRRRPTVTRVMNLASFFFQLLSRRRVDNVVVTFCVHKWRHRGESISFLPEYTKNDTTNSSLGINAITSSYTTADLTTRMNMLQCLPPNVFRLTDHEREAHTRFDITEYSARMEEL